MQALTRKAPAGASCKRSLAGLLTHITLAQALKGGELPCPLDADGCFTEEVPDFQGM